MKTLTLNVCRIIMLTFILYSCARNSDTDSESVAIDNNEYYVDSSGKYLIELGDDGYNIYMDGEPYENANLTNKGPQTSTIGKQYQYNYGGICIIPPQWPRGQNNPKLSNLPVKQTGKKIITSNFATVGGGYRVTPRPSFLGGSKYSCYECLVNSINRNDFFVGVCNGSVFISGALSSDPQFENIKNMLSGIKFTPDESDQFAQTLNSTGVYNCTKR